MHKQEGRFRNESVSSIRLWEWVSKGRTKDKQYTHKIKLYFEIRKEDYKH